MAEFRNVCDLPEVIAEMLDSVVDGVESADLEALDRDPIEQRILAKIRQHPIDFTGRFFHARRKLGFAHGSSSCEFGGAVPRVQRSTSPTDNPLAKVARHVQPDMCSMRFPTLLLASLGRHQMSSSERTSRNRRTFGM